VLDKRTSTWKFYFWDNGTRRSRKIGSVRDYPTKAAAFKAAKPLRHAVESNTLATIREGKCVTVSDLIDSYRVEKMPQRPETRRGYEKWLRNYIEPKWGGCVLMDVQARPVELWMNTLPLAPKSKSHIRGLLHGLWDYAMWRGEITVQRNPIELVTIKGVSKRTRKPRSLSVEEFQHFAEYLKEPFRTLALLQVCFGLRISEALGLKWCDIGWNDGSLQLQRGIVRQHVDDVKTDNSARTLHIGPELLSVLKEWKQTTQFSKDDDWVFASPVQLGRLPWCYKHVWQLYKRAASAAGIDTLSTHSLRHTYRTWLDATGAPIGVQQKLMRHADIRTTMNVYGDALTPDLKETSEKIARLVLVTKRVV
jgi:integrase